MKIVDLIHRWTGGFIGLLLAITGLTGAILVHRKWWVLLPSARDAQDQSTTRLANTAARLMADATVRPRTLTFADSDFGLDRLTYKGTAGAYADQSGDIVTTWSTQWERPELWLFDLHHHLLSGDVGETIIGVAGLAGIGFVLTGAVLWWRTRKTFAFRLLPKRLSRPAIMRHHRDLGIVLGPLLLLSLITGALMIFRPLTAIAFGLGAPKAIQQMLAPPKGTDSKLGKTLDWAGMIVKARTQFPKAEIRSLSLPRGKGGGPITLRLRQLEEWVPGGRTMMWFDAATGEVIGSRDARKLGRQPRAYNMLLALHAAEVGGILYRLVITFSGLALTMLGSLTVWTFWFKRGPERAAKQLAR